MEGGFASYLWGTWETTNHEIHGLVEEGTITIGFDTIRVTNFRPRIYPPVAHSIPFQGIAPNADLRGFSESGRFAINNIGRTDYIRYRFSEDNPNILALEFDSGDLFFQKTGGLW